MRYCDVSVFALLAKVWECGSMGVWEDFRMADDALRMVNAATHSGFTIHYSRFAITIPPTPPISHTSTQNKNLITTLNVAA